jgi:endonuclease/exonuclease/phosphatase family metal-dependent hydrolase
MVGLCKYALIHPLSLSSREQIARAALTGVVDFRSRCIVVLLLFMCLLLTVNAHAWSGDPWGGGAPIDRVVPVDRRFLAAEVKRGSGDDRGDGEKGETALASSLPDSTPPSVWLGTAPFCAASRRDCEILGLNYVRSDTSGDGLPCLCGEKVLCEVPQIRLKTAESDHVTSFTIVQYNILDRPFWVGHDGQRERVCRIPQALARHITSQEHVDAIVFNESFVGMCAPDLRMTEILTYYGWSHYLPRLSTWWKPSNGGIFIASRWPIMASQTMVYRACSFSDCLAAKGVQYAKIKKTVGGRSKSFHLFGTHLQGYLGINVPAVRRQQLQEMAEFVAQQRIPADEPVLLAGDFNTRGPSGQVFQDLVDILRVDVPTIVGERRATMDVDNTLVGRGPWWVDYVLPSAVHQQPREASMETVALRTEREFAICYEAKLQPYYVAPDAPTCTRTVYVRDLSDHYPVIGRFEYRH